MRMMSTPSGRPRRHLRQDNQVAEAHPCSVAQAMKVVATLLGVVVVGIVLMFPNAAWGQAGSVDVFAGGGTPPLGGGRVEVGSATGGVTRWWWDRWGIGVWHSARIRPQGAPLLHHIAPSIRWRRMGDPWSLKLGFRPILMTNDSQFSSFVVPVPTAEVFVGYRLSSSLRIQGGGFYYIDSFDPTLGIAWTFGRRGPGNRRLRLRSVPNQPGSSR